MTIIQALLLSIVEGITEFLPISSTGHLTLATNILNIPETEFVKSYIIIIQLGAIAAVILVYFKRLLTDFETWKHIIIAFLPGSVIGFILYKFIKSYLIGNEILVVLSLIIGGIILIIFDKNKKEKTNTQEEIDTFSYKKSVTIGLFQTIAMIPGVSRSGATIIGGMLQGLSKKAAVEFSFLLAIPTMLGATVLDLSNVGASFTASEFQLLALGIAGSFITALIAIKGFLKYVETKGMAVFGYYRIIIGVVYFLFIFLR